MFRRNARSRIAFVGISAVALAVIVASILIIGELWQRHGISKLRKTHYREQEKLGDIGKALTNYRLEEGHYPSKLEILAIEKNLPPESFLSAYANRQPGIITNLSSWSDFIYIEGISTDDGAKPSAIVFGSPHLYNQAGSYVLYTDGSVLWLDKKNLSGVKCSRPR